MLFVLAATVCHFFLPGAALAIILVLISFALLEALCDFCVGCLVYTYVVLPVFGNA